MLVITIMQKTNVAPDLDLLRAFARLYELRHVTRAASALGLSQSAMSHALGRLRETFDDQLFVRTPRGMVPTERADVLSSEVARILAGVEALMTKRTALSPKEMKRTFIVGSADYGHIVVLPGLVRALAKEAPGVDLSCISFPDDIGLALERGTLDLAMHISAPSPSLMGQKLFDERFVCVLRRGHPVLRRGFNLERYIELDHVLIAPRGRPGGVVDRVLAEKGLSRRVRLAVPSFATALMLVSESEMVLTAPERLVTRFGRRFPLAIRKPPLDIPGFSLWQFWHERTHRDPEHQFLREQIARAH
jgi:DNA-binding transcriptional LysR family regulator